MQIEKNKKFVDYGKRSVGENIGANMHKMDGDIYIAASEDIFKIVLVLRKM